MGFSISYSPTEIDFIRHRIMLGDVPNLLYKYYNIAGINRLLESKSIYFSNCKEFNDPFESAVNIISEHSPEKHFKSLVSVGMDIELARELTRQISKGLINGKSVLKEATEEALASFGYFCMTTKPDNLLMWAHYADSHRGVCVKFDILKDLDTFTVPIPVEYDEHYIDFDTIDGDLLSVIRRKSPEWKYENEYRIVKAGYHGCKEIASESIMEIIFGCRTPKEDINTIKELASTLGYTQIQFSQAREKRNAYGLDIIRI